MKKTIRMAALLLLTAQCLGALTACSEDAPDVVFTHPADHFMPADDDQSDEAQLRRSFFSETGSYLMFNDTLQHVYQGLDINGDERYFTELIDMLYSVGQSAATTTVYTYTYLTTMEQKQQVVDFLKDYVLTHLTDKVRPFSWFVSNVITGVNNMGATMRPYALTNQRCVAIAASYLVQRERTDEQKQAYAQRILNTVASQVANNHDDSFDSFYLFSAGYYNRSYSEKGFTTVSLEQLYQLGFLAASSTVSTFPSMSQDLSAYSVAVIQYSDDELQRMYGRYDIVMQKLAIMKQTLEELGYVF